MNEIQVLLTVLLLVLAGCSAIQGPGIDTTSVTSQSEPSETASSSDLRQTASELSHRTDYNATVSVGDGQVGNHRLSPSISFQLYVDEDEVVQSTVGSGTA